MFYHYGVQRDYFGRLAKYFYYDRRSGGAVCDARYTTQVSHRGLLIGDICYLGCHKPAYICLSSG